MEQNKQVRATLKGARLSPLKGRLVADLVRGKMVEQAIPILQLTNKKAAGLILKVIESAVANAENQWGLEVATLCIDTIYVEKGTVLRRLNTRAKGRGDQIRKPTCHIYVTLLGKLN
ncbi:MAG: 50S ribosomal protein L22 [Gammaproteobacteria bacterium]|nr:50S ribosomal protein L22 [Gammaproteobacteria bacterium]